MENAPLISGFTFIKNGLSLGYPIRESIESIEPLCDEIIINVGFDDPNLIEDDGTYKYLTEHFTHPKFRFLKSHWNPELTSKGLILSEQTNIALKECKGKYCQYIQGDEVLHESDLSNIQNAVMEMEKDQSIEGLVFKYIHFYGNVDVVKHTRNTYRREVRLIRNKLGIKSILDAQSFRRQDDSKPNCRLIDASVYHYGWARKEQVMDKKVSSFNKIYHGKEYESEKFTYQRIWGLKSFTGTHPKVMHKWIDDHRNDLNILKLSLKHEWKNVGLAISDIIENITNYRIGEYKSYRLINRSIL